MSLNTSRKTANHILQVVRGMQNSKGSVMNALYRIAGGHAEAMEFEPAENSLRRPHIQPGFLIDVIDIQNAVVPLIISLYAMQQGLKKVVAKCNRENYAGIAQSVGLDSVISPKLITAMLFSTILSFMPSRSRMVVR